MSYEEQFTRSGRAEPPKRAHSLSLEGRKKLTVSGVEDVESFDEKEIVMQTAQGSLVVCGEGLSVSKLSVDAGDVGVDGVIHELRYEEPAEKRGLLARLFR